jgi:hypothetical protein
MAGMTSDMITALLAECEAEARAQGWSGLWEPTEADIEYVVEKLGRKPTREEWVDARLPYVGGGHVTTIDDDPPTEDRLSRISAAVAESIASDSIVRLDARDEDDYTSLCALLTERCTEAMPVGGDQAFRGEGPEGPWAIGLRRRPWVMSRREVSGGS